MQPLNWREKFVGIITLLTGLLILLVFVFDFISSRSSDVTAAEGNIVIHRDALFLYIRTGVAILVGIIGGYALLKQSKAGWILCITFQLLTGMIAGYFTFLTATLGMYAWMAGPAIGFLLALLSVIFLTLPSTREKFRVSSKTILPTLLFVMAIGSILYFLQ